MHDTPSRLTLARCLFGAGGALLLVSIGPYIAAAGVILAPPETRSVSGSEGRRP